MVTSWNRYLRLGSSHREHTREHDASVALSSMKWSMMVNSRSGGSSQSAWRVILGHVHSSSQSLHLVHEQAFRASGTHKGMKRILCFTVSTRPRVYGVLRVDSTQLHLEDIDKCFLSEAQVTNIKDVIVPDVFIYKSSQVVLMSCGPLAVAMDDR